MKKILSVMVCASLSLGAMAQAALAFNANAGVKSKMTVYDGTEVTIAPFSLIFDEITVYLEFRSPASVPADSNPSGSSSILRKRP